MDKRSSGTGIRYTFKVLATQKALSHPSHAHHAARSVESSQEQVA